MLKFNKTDIILTENCTWTINRFILKLNTNCGYKIFKDFYNKRMKVCPYCARKIEINNA